MGVGEGGKEEKGEEGKKLIAMIVMRVRQKANIGLFQELILRMPFISASFEHSYSYPLFTSVGED